MGGSLDASFGNGGIVLTDFFGSNDNANALLIQPDGKIVAVGWGLDPSNASGLGFGLARYNTDGSLDPTFGSGGKVAWTATVTLPAPASAGLVWNPYAVVVL